MKFLDTNIFLRYLVAPSNPTDRRKQQACTTLLQAVRAGKEAVTTTEAVIVEVLWVLCSPRQYNLSHADAAARLRPILGLRGLTLPHKRTYLRALDLFATFPSLDIADALIVAHMERLGVRELLSYDHDFDPLPSVQRQEP